MARLPRIAAAGYPHHVIQRGNNRQSIFVDDTDRERYLALLKEIAGAHRIAVHAYVLMPNHVHLLATPQTGDAISRFMQALGRRYVRWFNDRHHRTGTLWEGRFRSTVVDADRYLLACMRYIELNPVRAGLCLAPEQYRWSSFAHHVGIRIDPIVTDHALFWGLGNTPFERQLAYRQLFDLDLPADQLDQIRRSTNRGRALASPAELRDGELPPASGWAQARPRGRPRSTRQTPCS
ncbi:MAG TPA: transposase [Burkholderiaceae bacterium]|nr:transposase [Burkholderiaceae bacterium]